MAKATYVRGGTVHTPISAAQARAIFIGEILGTLVICAIVGSYLVLTQW